MSKNTNITTPEAPPRVIAEEFFRVLGRHEALQNIFCDNTCLCPQFTQGMHLILPRWNWGVTRIVCFGLGSFKNVQQNGISKVSPPLPYAQVPLTTQNSLIFNKSPLDRNDPVQVMVRHIAALDIAAALRMCSNPRGIEHAVSKGFARITMKIAEEEGWGSLQEGNKEWDRFVGKIQKAYEKLEKKGEIRTDLPEVPIYFCDPGHTEKDKGIFKVLHWMLQFVWRQPVHMVSMEEAHDLIDSRTLVYTVDPDFPVRSSVLTKSTPVAMIWRSHEEEGREDVLTQDVRPTLRQYQEFELNKSKGPHTIGASHFYIRKDAIVSAWKWAPGCFPPWKLRHPFDKNSMDKVADQLLADGWLNELDVAKHTPPALEQSKSFE
ncbi:hypothetical protein QBC44DRAFT_402483 [Cladorrhinum sp. PSN332]|nr:hypothetical protein QBC44DRAFT_402483 [Cladorrhinum sp. PSN332]